MPAPVRLPDVALAILLVDGRYALQHRDDRADLPWPGYWTLFGGSVEAGEAPGDAIRREINEEVTLDVPDWRFVRAVDYDDTWRGRPGRLFIFEADVTALWSRHQLREGQGTGVFPGDQLPEPTIPIIADIIAGHRATAGRA